MNASNATPPADFPVQVIMMDTDLAARRPQEGFYLRVTEEPGGHVVEAIRLTGAYTVPEARKMAVEKGFEPTHWMDVRAAAPTAF